MRAVNNTLREIILRERPLTVTNNDSLVLSPPLPLLPLFASLSIHPFAPPSTCLSTLFLFTPRDLVYMPLYCMGATLRNSAKFYVAASNRRKVFIFESNRVYVHVNTNPCSSSSSPPLSFDGPFVTTNFSILDSKTFSFPAVPSRASKLIRSTGSVNAITTSACIQRGTDVTVVA